MLIGAEPRTGWLPGQIERDEIGFVLTRGDRVGVAIQGKLDAGAPGDHVRSPVGVAVEAERLP